MHNKYLLVLALLVVFIGSWSFWGSNYGSSYRYNNYFPTYSTYSGGPAWYTYAYSAPVLAARPTFTMPSYYTTFGNYQYYGRFTNYGGYW